MPMVKAGVRAMDALSDYAKIKGWADIDKFALGGASKRGWNTWLTAAVDTRVVAIVPIVMDLLDMDKGLNKHYQSLGGWSFVFEPYWAMNLTTYLNTPEFDALAQIIDVKNYQQFLDLPKLVIDSTGDEFFILDDDQAWWQTRPNNTWRLMCHNAEHSMITGLPELMTGTIAFFEGIITQSQVPTFDWKIDDVTGAITVTSPTKPKHAYIRSAITMNNVRRDFRLFTGDTKANPCKFIKIHMDGDACLNPVLWDKQEIQPSSTAGGDFVYVATEAVPKDGRWKGFLVELEYDGPAPGMVYVFSTQVSILPKTFPFPAPKPGVMGDIV